MTYLRAVDPFPLESAEYTKLHEFYARLAGGRLSTTRCAGCGQDAWPPRGLCSHCGSDRFDWMYEPEELAEWVEPVGRLAAEADEVYALFNNNRDDFAPRSAAIFRGLLDEAGISAAGGVEPPPLRPTLF